MARDQTVFDDRTLSRVATLLFDLDSLYCIGRGCLGQLCVLSVYEMRLESWYKRKPRKSL